MRGGQSVAVWLGVFALPGPQGSAYAGNIDHDHGLPQIFRGEMGDDPHKRISSAAGTPGNDQFDGLGGILIRQCHATVQKNEAQE